MELLVQVLALGETPTYQMREHCTDKDKKEGRQKVHFLGVFFFSGSFEIGGGITKLMNLLDD